MALGRFSIPDLISAVWTRTFDRALPRLTGATALWLTTRTLGVECGRRVVAYGFPDIRRSPRSRIVMGDDVTLVSASRRCTSATLMGPVRLRTLSAAASIEIGRRVGLNGTSITARSRTIRVGEGTMVAPNVVIVDSDFHAPWPAPDRLENPGLELDEDVTIGQNVWVGMSCIVLKGVTIGDNAIVAAGSVVTRDVPADTVVAGNPARVVSQAPTVEG